MLIHTNKLYTDFRNGLKYAVGSSIKKQLSQKATGGVNLMFLHQLYKGGCNLGKNSSITEWKTI